MRPNLRMHTLFFKGDSKFTAFILRCWNYEGSYPSSLDLSHETNHRAVWFSPFERALFVQRGVAYPPPMNPNYSESNGRLYFCENSFSFRCGRTGYTIPGRALSILTPESGLSMTTSEGSFSAGSTPIFASKYAFCSIFQDLQNYHLLASTFAEFCKFPRTFQGFEKKKFTKIAKIASFLQNFAKFCKILQIFNRICKIL